MRYDFNMMLTSNYYTHKSKFQLFSHLVKANPIQFVSD